MQLPRLAHTVLPLLLALYLPAVHATPAMFIARQSSDSDYTSDSEFQAQMLNSTNTYRALYQAKSVVWNASAATYGVKWADACVFAHSHGPYGENIAEGFTSVIAAVDAWGNERTLYDFADPGYSDATGHFTQLVWQSTTSIGCGRTACGSSGEYVVCEYYPVGNVIGYFAQNVLPEAGSTATATATATTTVEVQASQTTFALAVFTGAADRPGVGTAAGMSALGALALGVLGWM